MARDAEHKKHIAAVFDRAASTYDAQEKAFFRIVGAKLAAQARLRRGERVLDVGCGRGASLIPAATAVGSTGLAVGIDLSPRMVSATLDDLSAQGLTYADARLGDAEDPPFAPEYFDAILAGLVLNFLPNPVDAIDAYYRLLRPGGRLLMSNPSPARAGTDAVDRVAHEALRPYFRDSNNLSINKHRTQMTGDALANLLESTDWIEVFSTTTAFPISFASADHYWRWKYSHGGRTMMERIPDHQLSRARLALTDALSGMTSRDGRLHLPMPVCFTSAVRG